MRLPTQLCLGLLPSVLLAGCSGEPESFSVRPPAVEIASPARNHSAVPNLVTDAAGGLLLSWTETMGERSEMYISTLTGDAWLPPVKIAAGPDWFVNWADVPEIAGDGAGNLIASFLVRSGNRSFGYDVNLVQSGDYGRTWTDPMIPHDDRSPTEHGFVAFLPLADGQFLVAWLDGRHNTPDMRKQGGSQSLRAAFIDHNGAMTHEGPVDLRVCDCCQPTAVKIPQGPAIVYRDRTGAEIRDISITWWDNDRWAGPFTVAEDNWVIHGCPVDGPNADVLASTLVVAWFTAVAGKPKVQVAFSDDHGRTFGPAIRVDAGSPAGKPDVVLLDVDTAMVSWLATDNGREQLNVRKVFKQGHSEDPRLISKIAESSGFPQMSNSNGKVYLAWTDGDRLRTAVVQP